MKVLGAIVALIVMLVILAPTIASMGFVRSIVVGKINENIDGRVEIADYNVGWGAPVTVTGVKLYDPQNQLILDVPKVTLGTSLSKLARGNFAFGDKNVIEVASFTARLDEQGKSNFEKLAKTSEPKQDISSDEPVKLPDISGKFTVNFKGKLESNASPVPVTVEPSTLVATITDINQPIQTAVKVAYRVGDEKLSTIEMAGPFSTVRNNLLDVEKITFAQKLAVTNANVAALEPFLKALGADTRIAGTVSGGFDVNATSLTALSATGQLEISNLFFSGGPIGADQFKRDKVTIPLNITRGAGADGKPLIKFENVGVQTTGASLTVQGEVPEEALTNLAAKKAPGAKGNLVIALDVTDLPTFTSMLRNTLNLQEGVQIQSGAIHEKLTVAIEPTHVAISQNLSAQAGGTRQGKAIELRPITITASATARPTPQALPDVRDLKLDITSAFATVTGGGASLAKLGITGNFDLGKLAAELGQFADLGKIQLAGMGDFAINTDGDLTDENKPVALKATANLQRVKIAGLADQQIDQDQLAILASGRITRAQNSPTGIEDAYLSATAGDPKAPLMQAVTNAKVDLTKSPISIPSFDQKINVMNLATLQKQYGGLVPALAEQKIVIQSGALYASASGSYDGTTLKLTTPAELSIPTLTVTQDGRRLLTKETVRAQLTGTISTEKSLGQIDGTITSSLVNATLKNLRFASLPTPTASGEIVATGTLEKLAPLLSAVGGMDELPYSGEFSVDQKITNAGDQVTILGGITIKQFTVYSTDTTGKRAAVLTEPQLAVKNDLALNFTSEEAKIKTLTVEMPQSRAVGVQVSGAVRKFNSQRNLDKVQLLLAYDLAKLWPIVHPMLIVPGEPDAYADLKIAGAYSKTFDLSGAYPATDAKGKALEWYESIRTLNATGGLSVDLLDTMGLNVQKFEPQFKIVNGKLTVNAEPATANEGKLNLTNVVVDLTQVNPVLTTPKKLRVLQDVKLNPVLADSLGKFASLVMSNATEATGLLDVTILECNQVPLGELVRERNKAKARLAFSVRDLHLNGPVPSAVAKFLDLGTQGFVGNIKDASVTLDNGEAASDVAILFQKEGTDKKTGKTIMRDVPLIFAGGIGMKDLDLRDFNVHIPGDLLPSKFRKVLPAGFAVPFTGTVDKWEFDPMRAITENAPNAILQGLQPGNLPIGDLFENLGRKKRK